MSYAVGLNSGSSFDGIDAVLVDLQTSPDGHPHRPVFVHGTSFDWPAEVGADVLRAFANELSIFELTRLNYVVGAVYAQAALDLLAEARVDPTQVSVIGYDGQTIYQEPPDRERMATAEDPERLYTRWSEAGWPCGLQIAESAIVAAATEIPTVSHFRPAEHALGGTGAPLMQYLDYVSFRDLGPVVTLNIGGISNLQRADPDRARMQAFDCGPGNVMIDHAMRRLLDRDYDAGGAIAAAGTVDEALLSELLAHPFFHRRPPRSAWRLDFGAAHADAILDRWSHLSPEDTVATLTRFSAEAIVGSLTGLVNDLPAIDRLIVSGGGARNATLLRMIERGLPDHMRLELSDDHGLPAQFKEAIKFATIASSTLHRVANNIPAASGASRFALLGKIALPPSAAAVGERPSAHDV